MRLTINRKASIGVGLALQPRKLKGRFGDGSMSLGGWKKSEPFFLRRRRLATVVGREGFKKVRDKLVFMITKHKDAESRRVARLDLDWVAKNYRGYEVKLQ